MFTKFIEKHGLKKIVVPLLIVVLFFCAVIWLTPSQMTALGDILTATKTATEVTASNNQTLDSMFTLPIMIAVLWPMAFVVFAFILNTLVSSGNSAKKERKFEVKFIEDLTSNEPDEYVIYPLGIHDLKEILNDSNKNVIDIGVLNPGMLQSINLGIDLCIAAVAADLSTIFALTGSDLADFSRQRLILIISIILFHTILALIVALLLNKYQHDKNSYKRFVWLGNILGFLSLVSSFYLLGYII